MCGHMCVCVRMNVLCVYIHAEAWSCLPLSVLIIQCGISQLNPVGQLAPSTGIIGRLPQIPGIDSGSGDLNWETQGPHVCTANILSTEPPSQPGACFSLAIYPEDYLQMSLMA